ncbi:MAG: HAMP domain-containing histidine kinase [Oscillospiraceae bacterium]|nr:HAMP domain-containing histidine kinase [Oscillospiraceae bacterium]
MKSFRARITLFLCIVLALFIVVSIVFTFLASKGLLFHREDLFFFGMSFYDFMLLVLTFIIAVVCIILLSNTATTPVRLLTNATREISSGNFDIELNLPEKTRELRELEQNFNMMVRELRSSDKMRKDFISNVSHELRTPLTIISGYADLLQEEGISEKDRFEYAALISKESERLVRLTSNLLRLSKMDSQEITIKRDTFRLDEQIRQTASLLASKWQAKNIDFRLDLENVLFDGDEELLSQVWFNLIENAIKFTDSMGRINVTLSGKDGFVEITVLDNGIGMDKVTMERMFEQFYQGDTSRKNEGSGMGLAITQKIVEIHGGLITAESGPRQGTKFIVSLPNPKN